jgi:hypothetical protein
MDHRLRKGEVVSLAATGAEGSLSVREGQVWLTRPGDHRDHLPGRGDRFPLGGDGPFVLEALTDATIALEVIPTKDSSGTIRLNLVLPRYPLSEAGKTC